ncbi:Mite allergen Der p 3 [Zancudomyces culisetae]|uniref:Mite allergen Der p 3 n=1 Tax=Zancudomyces culisetae TaxID=1213189 RepID=A0A1R1PGH8_ZANCU|nr:Mite allergen Der p 3 [Zancudomyces culisetae]|eukprot:OMH80081.1 Mite allergen Der p 3 [Zancudomyces culisetae]
MIFSVKQSALKAIVTTLAFSNLNPASAAAVCNSGLVTKNLSNSTADSQNNARILGGQPAKIEEFPYMGGVVIMFSTSGNFCTGSLISDKFVVTLSDCFYEQTLKMRAMTSDISVTFGTDLNSLKADVQSYNVKKYYAHPDYSSSSTSKGVTSIGLIELSEPVPKEVATPAKIYNGKVTNKMSLTTVGWGSTSLSVTTKLSDTLNKVTVSPSSSKDCEVLGGLWTGNDGNLICTVVSGGKSAYAGDTGGPLVYTDNGSNLLVGLFYGLGSTRGSTTVKPGSDGSTNYFSRLSSYVDWIVDTTGISKSDLVDEKQSASSGDSADSQNTSSSTSSSSSAGFLSKSVTPLLLAVSLLTSTLLY